MVTYYVPSVNTNLIIYCSGASEFSCARVDSTVRKKKGSKSHLQGPYPN